MKIEFEFTPKILQQLATLSGLRIPMHHMATIIGTSEETLYKAYKNLDEVRHTIDDGRAKAKSKVTQTLYLMAIGDEKIGTKPDFQALKFWCETQEDFKRTHAVEINGTLDSKNITDEELDKRIAAAIEVLR